MTVTAAMIAQVRRMTAEPTVTPYSDAAIQGYIEAYPCLDERGEMPYILDTTVRPPTQDDNPDWIPSYDLAAAAADIWEEKAAALAAGFDFTTDGGSYHRSQAYQQAQAQARHYRARRKPQTIKQVMHPLPDAVDGVPVWLVNRAEVD
jgi:hypothetical protein